MDAPDYDAVIRRHVEELQADLPPGVRAELDAVASEFAAARAQWERDEAVLADAVRGRAQTFGAAFEQVFRAAGEPQTVQWRDPAPRTPRDT